MLSCGKRSLKHFERPDSGQIILVVEKWGMVIDYLVKCWLLLWTCFASFGKGDKTVAAKKLASFTFRILVGVDESFADTYGSEVELCIAQGRISIRPFQSTPLLFHLHNFHLDILAFIGALKLPLKAMKAFTIGNVRRAVEEGKPEGLVPEQVANGMC